MAITNAQQFKQLVNPPMNGKRPGYRGDAAAAAGSPGMAGPGPGADPGDGPASGKGSVSDNRSDYMGSKGKVGPTNTSRGGDNILEKLLNLSPTKRAIDFISNKITGLRGPKNIDPYSGGRTGLHYDRPTTPDDNDRGNEKGIIPILSASAPVTSGATTESEGPATTANLNRIAYRLMADGGAVIDDEPRQAYGLGSIVKKITRSVKKVAKSPIGKAALLGAVGFGIPGTSIGGLFGRASFGKAATGLFGQQGIGATLAAGKAKFLGKPFTKTVADFAGDKLAFNAARTAAGVPGLGLGAKVGLGIAGLSALPLLGVGVEEDEEQEEFSPYLGEGLDIAAIRANPRAYQGQAYRLMSEGGSGDLSNDPNYKGWKKMYEVNPDVAAMNDNHKQYLNFYERNQTKQAEGSKEPVAKKVMPLLDMDGQEMDLRAEGGFVPIGRMEKADDVPARLSKNEFVFTADAVRNAGEGDVDKGAEVMYNMMKNLESGGEVSEESQGLEGARKMFQTSQRLEEVL